MTDFEIIPPSGFVKMASGEYRFRFAGGKSKFITPDEQGSSVEYSLAKQKLFPDDQIEFSENWVIRLPEGVLLHERDIVLLWTVFLDNAPPSKGEWNLIDQFGHTERHTTE